MREGKKYHCPTCTQMYNTETEAEKCKQSHQVFSRDYVSCEICGRSWCADIVAYGPKLARQEAEKCERAHRENLGREQNEKA